MNLLTFGILKVVHQSGEGRGVVRVWSAYMYHIPYPWDPGTRGCPAMARVSNQTLMICEPRHAVLVCLIERGLRPQSGACETCVVVIPLDGRSPAHLALRDRMANGFMPPPMPPAPVYFSLLETGMTCQKPVQTDQTRSGLNIDDCLKCSPLRVLSCTTLAPTPIPIHGTN